MFLTRYCSRYGSVCPCPNEHAARPEYSNNRLYTCISQGHRWLPGIANWPLIADDVVRPLPAFTDGGDSGYDGLTK